MSSQDPLLADGESENQTEVTDPGSLEAIDRIQILVFWTLCPNWFCPEFDQVRFMGLLRRQSRPSEYAGVCVHSAGHLFSISICLTLVENAMHRWIKHAYFPRAYVTERKADKHISLSCVEYYDSAEIQKITKRTTFKSHLSCTCQKCHQNATFWYYLFRPLKCKYFSTGAQSPWGGGGWSACFTKRGVVEKGLKGLKKLNLS